MQRYKNNTKIFIVLVLFNYSYSGNRRNTVPFPFSEELSLCNTQFVFCGLEMGGSDLDGDFSCFILRLNDDDGLATERLRCEGAAQFAFRKNTNFAAKVITINLLKYELYPDCSSGVRNNIHWCSMPDKVLQQ